MTGDEANALMVWYLKEQNRPYSATEVSANLHGKVSLSFTPESGGVFAIGLEMEI